MSRENQLKPWMIISIIIALIEVSDFIYVKLHWYYIAEALILLDLALGLFFGISAWLRRQRTLRAKQ